MTDVVAAGLDKLGQRAAPSGSRTSPTPSWPTLAAALPRLHLPAPHRHLAVARRPRRAVGAGDGARRPPGRARRHLRLPRPLGPARGHHPGRLGRHRARHRARGADRRRRRCKARAASIARGGLDAAGFVRSPYTVGGKQRLFAEPPHMQASMLFLPAGAAVPEVGDEVDCRVRFTATTFDAGRDQLTRDAARPVRPAARRPSRHRVVLGAQRRRAPPPRRGRARPRPGPRSRGRRPGAPPPTASSSQPPR